MKYVLILGFIALLVIMAPKYLGHDISNIGHDISNTLNGVATSLHGAGHAQH